jgi:hypothetical protein
MPWSPQQTGRRRHQKQAAANTNGNVPSSLFLPSFCRIWQGTNALSSWMIGNRLSCCHLPLRIWRGRPHCPSLTVLLGCSLVSPRQTLYSYLVIDAPTILMSIVSDIPVQLWSLLMICELTTNTFKPQFIGWTSSELLFSAVQITWGSFNSPKMQSSLPRNPFFCRHEVVCISCSVESRELWQSINQCYWWLSWQALDAVRISLCWQTDT